MATGELDFERQGYYKHQDYTKNDQQFLDGRLFRPMSVARKSEVTRRQFTNSLTLMCSAYGFCIISPITWYYQRFSFCSLLHGSLEYMMLNSKPFIVRILREVHDFVLKFDEHLG
jgi:hypothetical protein